MKPESRFMTLALGSTVLLLSTHGRILADLIKAPIVSAGSATTTTGSLINVGQSFIGTGRSRTHMMSAGGIPAVVHLLTRPLPGDLDGDGDKDLDDHAIFVVCLGGPGESLPPRDCTQEQFDRADVQADHDVDMGDYGEVFTGLTVR